MEFFRRLRKSKGDRKLTPPSELKSTVAHVPLMDRLTELQEAGRDLIIKLHRRAGDKGSGYMNKTYTVMDVDPTRFELQVGGDLGDGSYEVTFADGGTTVMYPGTKIPEKHILRVAGFGKKSKEKDETKSRKQSELELIEKLLTAPADSLAGKLASKLLGESRQDGGDLEKAAEVLVKLKSLVPEAQYPDPIQMAERALGLLEKASTLAHRPPVSTSSGAGAFWDKLGGSLATALGGAAPAPQIPQQATPAQGFAGTAAPTATPQTTQPLQQAQAEAETLSPWAKLRAMANDQNVSDEDVAAFAVEAIDSYVKLQFGGVIPGVFMGLLDDPRAALNLAFSYIMIPAFRDAERLKDLGVGYVEAWKAQTAAVEAAEAAQAMEAAIDDANTQSKSPAPNGSADASDSESVQTEDDKSADSTGEEH